MTRSEDISKLIKQLQYASSEQREKKILDNVLATMDESANTQKAKQGPYIWRTIMKSPSSKIAAAAVIAFAVTLSIMFIEKTTTPVYAFEQTVKAHHSVRSLLINDFAPDQNEPKKFWIRCDRSGQIRDVRMHFPQWASPNDGAKTVIWSNGVAQVYFEKKNSLLITKDKSVGDHMLKVVEQCDPRLAVQHLREMELKGKVKLEIDEPDDKTKPITVTATPTTGGRRDVLIVDRESKLVTTVKKYILKDDKYQYCGSMECSNYNQPIDDATFSLEKDVPANVTRIDQTTGDVGLAQGDMSKDEVVVEVAKQFFEALIAEDYDKAGKLLEGLPGTKIKEIFGGMKFLRIISIGEVQPHPNPLTQGVVVPCVVEIEKDDKVSEWKLDRLGVRQVYGQPDRWTIFGGI